MGQRPNLRIALLGINNTGKSTYIVNNILKNYDFSKQKGIIVTETIDNKAYSKIKRADDYNQLRALRSGCVKFWDFDSPDDFAVLNSIHSIINEGHLRNGVMVFEDCTNYIDQNPHRIVKKFCVNHRMFGLDLFFTTHALSDLPKWFRKRMNYIVIFKTGEDFTGPKDIRQMGYRNSDAIYEAWVKVMNDPSPFANITVACNPILVN